MMAFKPLNVWFATICASLVSAQLVSGLSSEQFLQLDAYLNEQLPDDPNPVKNVELIREISTRMESDDNEPVKIVLALVDATDCTDTVLEALDQAFKAFDGAKKDSHLLKVISRYVSLTIAPKCIHRFDVQARDLRAQVDPSRVEAFYRQIMADNHLNDRKSFVKCLAGPCERLSAANWLIVQLKQLQSQTNSGSAGSDIYNLSAMEREKLYTNFKQAFREHLVEPCEYLTGIYGQLLQKFDEFIQTKLNRFVVKDNKPRYLAKLSPQFKESLYLFRVCSLINESNRDEKRLMTLFQLSVAGAM